MSNEILPAEVLATGRYLVDFDTRGLAGQACDVLVIGGGVAGLSAALAAAEGGADVLVLCKDAPRVSNTAWAQGGIAAAVGPEDDVGFHTADTLRIGCGLSDAGAVRAVVEGAPAAVADLERRGARFDRDERRGRDGGHYALGREGGHSHRRILHRGDATGRECSRTLVAAARAEPRIALDADAFVLDILTHEGRCVGVIVRRRDGTLHVLRSRAVILAAGGAGRLFRETSNVRAATGDGIAAAFRAGARARDFEFVQFHPTTLYLAGSDRVLVTEAVRGEGAHLIDDEGHRFLADRHPDAELAPRDFVSRAIVEHLARPGVANVFLDLRHLPKGRTASRFPGLVQTCGRYGLDPEKDPIPVRPAAHYFIGGIVTDLDGATSVDGLLACGEASCSGLHGANRLASNSLLEGLVLGARTGRAALAARTTVFDGHIAHATARDLPATALDVEDLRKALVSRMWRCAGVLRNADGLTETGQAIHLWRRFIGRVRVERRSAFELENLLLLGALVSASAAWRAESRGTHGRSDHPERNDEAFAGHLVWQAGETPAFQPVEHTDG